MPCGISVAYGELTLGLIELDAGRLTLAGEYCRRTLATALETGEHGLHIGSLAALAHVERQLGHFAAARLRLEEAVNVCAQPFISHCSQLATILLEMGHLECAERDWPAARQHFNEALATKGINAAETQDAQAGLAEVAWAEQDLAQAGRLLDQVIHHAATAAATRRRAEQLKLHWGLADVDNNRAATAAVRAALPLTPTGSS